MDVVWKEGEITVVGEIKKSSKSMEGARAQLVYYLYALKKLGFNVKGYILVPKERKRVEVKIEKEDIEYVEKLLEEIKEVITSDRPPEVERKSICSKCGYFELCWA